MKNGKRKNKKAATPPKGYAGHDLSWTTVKLVLKQHRLSVDAFGRWFYGQTGPIIEQEDGSMELGVYGHDLDRYIEWRKNGTVPIWD